MWTCCQTKECFPQSILKLDLGPYDVQRGFCLLCTSAPKFDCSLTSFHCRLGTCGRENRLDDSVCFATQIGHKLFPQFRLQGELAYKPKLFNFALPCRTSVHSSIQKPVAGRQVYSCLQHPSQTLIPLQIICLLVVILLCSSSESWSLLSFGSSKHKARVLCKLQICKPLCELRGIAGVYSDYAAVLCQLYICSLGLLTCCCFSFPSRHFDYRTGEAVVAEDRVRPCGVSCYLGSTQQRG